jgi:glycosyltransferase involved in cell wall biosynthesis
MRLLIVSDTYMRRQNGIVLAYSPVVSELQSFEEKFQQITWIGMQDERRQQNAVKEYKSNIIEYYILPRLGGSSILEKFRVICYLPFLVIKLVSEISRHDVIHTRGPCYPAYIAVWLSWLFRDKIWWNKFATNWQAEGSSLAFRLHREILKRGNFSKVTINGLWPGLPSHIIQLENPCLSDEQIQAGAAVTGKKIFSKPYSLVFIGNIELEKGILEVFSALSSLKNEDWFNIDIVGNGSQITRIPELSSAFSDKVTVHGSVSSEKVHEILAGCHFLLLPSHSEGLPKVIAEASCWGCIPVVSDVGSIPQYISDKDNGFLWEINGEQSYGDVLMSAVDYDDSVLKNISSKAHMLSTLFTFSRYVQRVSREIFQ